MHPESITCPQLQERMKKKNCNRCLDKNIRETTTADPVFQADILSEVVNCLFVHTYIYIHL